MLWQTESTFKGYNMLTDKELDEIEARLVRALPDWVGGLNSPHAIQLLADAVALLAEVKAFHAVMSDDHTDAPTTGFH